jgi:hypothetical protein
MLVDESEGAVSALEDVGLASELRFVETSLLEVMSPLPLETLMSLPALLEDGTSMSSALLPFSPQAAIMAAMLNVAKSENFFICLM